MSRSRRALVDQGNNFFFSGQIWPGDSNGSDTAVDFQGSSHTTVTLPDWVTGRGNGGGFNVGAQFVHVWNKGFISAGNVTAEQEDFVAAYDGSQNILDFPGNLISAGYLPAVSASFGEGIVDFNEDGGAFELGDAVLVFRISWRTANFDTIQIYFTENDFTIARDDVPIPGAQYAYHLGSSRFEGAGLPVAFNYADYYSYYGDNDANQFTGTAWDEYFSAGGGDDTINAGAGDDTVQGHGGADTLHGNDGDDYLIGGDGDDIIFGDNGADRLYGEAGNDTLYGGSGPNYLYGGPGDDLYVVIDPRDVIGEAPGEGTADRVRADVSYALAAGAHIEILSTANDQGLAPIDLSGNELANAIVGNNGPNVLNGNGGADSLFGLAGDDSYFVNVMGDSVHEEMDRGFDRVYASASYVLTPGSHIERLTTTNNAGTAPINLTGNEFANAIYGNAGNNVLDGAGGPDTLLGLAGDDHYYIDNALDVIVDGVGQGALDRAFVSVDYRLGAGVQVEILSTNNHAGTAPIKLTGNALANTIYGNAGHNYLDGAGGADLLMGLAGNDWYFVDNIGDRIVESTGQGTDDRVFASVTYRLTAGAQIEILSTSRHAGTDPINLTGNELRNAIYGNLGSNILDGAEGADTLVGLAGNDSYYVDDASDTVIEGAQEGTLDRVYTSVSYRLTVGAHVEIVSTNNNAGTVALNLTGNELANTIYGNAGVNVLNGGLGTDTLLGLAGADIFLFDSNLGASNIDRILDFGATDKVRLENAVFTGLPEGALSANAFVSNASSDAAQDASDRIIYNRATGALLYDADGSDATSQPVQFAFLEAGLNVTSSQFEVI